MGAWIYEHHKNVKWHYTVNVTHNTYGIIVTETSLKHIMANCTDFEEEEALLQSMGQKMGDTIDHTPKCHSELSGKELNTLGGALKATGNRSH